MIFSLWLKVISFIKAIFVCCGNDGDHEDNNKMRFISNCCADISISNSNPKSPKKVLAVE